MYQNVSNMNSLFELFSHSHVLLLSIWMEQLAIQAASCRCWFIFYNSWFIEQQHLPRQTCMLALKNSHQCILKLQTIIFAWPRYIFFDFLVVWYLQFSCSKTFHPSSPNQKGHIKVALCILIQIRWHIICQFPPGAPSLNTFDKFFLMTTVLTR